MSKSIKWAHKAVVYQIYPRSFKDGNGDGVGDLPGILSKLEYLSWLGIGAIWISPLYTSPMVDFGYDISDYTNIDPIFGNLEDFDRLVKKAHQLNIKVMMDFVPNHTSDRHPWFLESRSSRNNPKRDWYIWKDPSMVTIPMVTMEGKHQPPNNWLSVFGGSGWEWDENTEQYYFHSFLKEQPDLNWRNPEVMEAMHGVMRFWLDRGVDGFRTDAIPFVIKDSEFQDDPPNPNYKIGQGDPYDAVLHVHSSYRPELINIIKGWCNVLQEYQDTFMISEIYVPSLEDLKPYFAACDAGVQSPFNFSLISLPWDVEQYKKFIIDYQNILSPNDWPNYVLGNHDKPRVVSRIGQKSARLAALLLFTLRGMPFVYYGEELGMEDAKIPHDAVQDPWEKNVPGIGLGRDPERTPMQWDSSQHAGFSDFTPWLPVSSDFEQRNVQIQQKDPGSMLNWYRNLITLRNSHPALLEGGVEVIGTGNDQVLAYTRTLNNEKFVILINFSEYEQKIALHKSATIILSTHSDRLEGEQVYLQGFCIYGHEGIILKNNH